jgi:hypothetical protein
MVKQITDYYEILSVIQMMNPMDLVHGFLNPTSLISCVPVSITFFFFGGGTQNFALGR